MTPRQIRHLRAAERFMPRLWCFAYPMDGRGFVRARRIALKAWCFAFTVRVRLVDLAP
jgi:hypothetical protein